MSPDGTEEPYEINTTWWSALNSDDDGESLDIKVNRYLASRSIALVIPGVPGIYIHGALGSSNDYHAVEASGVKRDVNRGIIDTKDVEAALGDPASRISLLRTRGIALIRARRNEKAFHPRGSQRVLMLSPTVFACLRGSPDGNEHILALVGITSHPVNIIILLNDLGIDATIWRDVLSFRQWTATAGTLPLTVEPYGVMWLKPCG
jgi:sucrose phosphorylase